MEIHYKTILLLSIRYVCRKINQPFISQYRYALKLLPPPGKGNNFVSTPHKITYMNLSILKISVIKRPHINVTAPKPVGSNDTNNPQMKYSSCQ